MSNSHDESGVFSVYVLRDPCQCDVIRYVGMTANEQQRRMAHESSPDIGTVVGLWAYSLAVFGRMPVMDVVAKVSGCRRDAAEAERAEIWKFRSRDDLMNEPFFSQKATRTGITKKVLWTYRRAVGCYRSLEREQHGELSSVGFLIDALEDQYPDLALVAGKNSWERAGRCF